MVAFSSKTSVHLDRDSVVLCWPQLCLSVGCHQCLSLASQRWCSRIRHIWDQTLGLVQGRAVSGHEAPYPLVLGAGPVKMNYNQFQFHSVFLQYNKIDRHASTVARKNSFPNRKEALSRTRLTRKNHPAESRLGKDGYFQKSTYRWLNKDFIFSNI